MQKTTKAMKMVASAKLRRAQDRVRAARPYANTMTRMLGRLASRAGDYHHPLLDERGDLVALGAPSIARGVLHPFVVLM